MPPVLLQMVSRTPVLYEVNIFVTNRFVPIPEVMEAERLLVEQLGVSGFYHVIARRGHMPHQTCCEAHTPMRNGAAAARQPLLQTGDPGLDASVHTSLYLGWLAICDRQECTGHDHASLGCRYGYMERVRQDESFVRELLGRVLHLLYKTLQERASKMPSLVKDLGLPTGSEIPVSVSIWVQDLTEQVLCIRT